MVDRRQPGVGWWCLSYEGKVCFEISEKGVWNEANLLVWEGPLRGQSLKSLTKVKQ